MLTLYALCIASYVWQAENVERSTMWSVPTDHVFVRSKQYMQTSIKQYSAAPIGKLVHTELLQVYTFGVISTKLV
jgi:hypothetical protein